MNEWQNDIEKYLKGELSPGEMHALEKQALSDPFLADALEGAAKVRTEEFASDLQQLKDQLQHRLRDDGKPVVPLWIRVSGVAASVLIVALVSYGVYRTAAPKTSGPLAQNKETQVPAVEDRTAPGNSVEEENESGPWKDDGASAPIPGKPQPPDEKPTTEDKPVQHSPEESKLAEHGKSHAGHDNRIAEAKRDVASEAETTDLDAGPIVEPLARVEQPVAVQPAEATKKLAEKATASKKEESPAQTRAAGTPRDELKNEAFVIRGKVTANEDGAGLPGVNVLLKDSNIGTITDAFGNYEITVHDANPTLVFSFIGYEQKEIKATQGEVNVAMHSDLTQLSEVVVTVYSTGRAEEVHETFEMAAPQGGRKAFRQYLEQNLQYPQLALQNNIEGRVTVQFTVEPTGHLTDFRVVKGIGGGCDEEVVRLIKQGPSWSPAKRGTTPVAHKVKVRMRFVLPKK
jgi:TonB family protein